MTVKKRLGLMEIFDIQIKSKITPNQFYLLCAMHQGITTPTINIHTELRGLLDQEFITEDKKLTPKAYAVIEEIEGYFNVKKLKAKKELMGTDARIMMKKYIECWPPGRLPTGAVGRVTVENIDPHFMWFFKTYMYDWDTIIKAAERYTNEKEREDWKYCKNSQYFVRKQNIDKTYSSELANYCELILSGDTDNEEPRYTEKIFT